MVQEPLVLEAAWLLGSSGLKSSGEEQLITASPLAHQPGTVSTPIPAAAARTNCSRALEHPVTTNGGLQAARYRRGTSGEELEGKCVR
ncbi:hypothetical protein NDU88_002424 [Pleurodeles waltl]|uniref:Uncharacterized protein n=1 Tax=Pleurodeles waltl TaxID=8319 RepID=A0AAV7LDQ9_PLEWA|nr:hypothetical protein NDU88_002424 [Pleurodeles waltl]